MAQRYKSKTSKRKKRSRRGRFIFSILFLCLISALLGFYGVKFMLLGSENLNPAEETGEEITNSGDDEEQATEVSDMIKKPFEEIEEVDTAKPLQTDSEDVSKQSEVKFKQVSVNLYAYQLGSFSTRENAEKFLLELEKKGERGTILEDKNFKVLNFVYADSALGEYFKKDAKNIADDAFLYSVEKTTEFSYESEKEKKAIGCINDYERALSIIGEAQSDYVAYLKSNLSREELVETSSMKLNELESMKKRLEDFDSGGVFFPGLIDWYESSIAVLAKIPEMEKQEGINDLSDIFINGIRNVS